LTRDLVGVGAKAPSRYAQGPRHPAVGLGPRAVAPPGRRRWASRSQRWPTTCGAADAADRLGITQRTLNRLIDAGQVPAYKMGRVLRVKATDLDMFLEHSRVAPGSLKHLCLEAKGDTGE